VRCVIDQREVELSTHSICRQGFLVGCLAIARRHILLAIVLLLSLQHKSDSSMDRA